MKFVIAPGKISYAFFQQRKASQARQGDIINKIHMRDNFASCISYIMECYRMSTIYDIGLRHKKWAPRLSMYIVPKQLSSNITVAVILKGTVYFQ